MTETQKQDLIREALTHTTDGPVSEFTVVWRGCRLAAHHPDLADDIAEFIADFVGASSDTVYASSEY